MTPEIVSIVHEDQGNLSLEAINADNNAIARKPSTTTRQRWTG